MDENFIQLCAEEGVDISLLLAAMEDFEIDPEPFTPAQWRVIKYSFQVAAGL